MTDSFADPDNDITTGSFADPDHNRMTGGLADPDNDSQHKLKHQVLLKFQVYVTQNRSTRTFFSRRVDSNLQFSFGHGKSEATDGDREQEGGLRGDDHDVVVLEGDIAGRQRSLGWLLALWARGLLLVKAHWLVGAAALLLT